MPTVPAAIQTSENLQENYWAFISFVSEDLPWCDWLYFILHGYPVPASLVHQPTKFGFPLPDHLSAFPDPNDLDHLGRIPTVLSRARYLIVVVSPHSAHASQTDEHIRAFKRAGGEERIIALVVEGQPVSSSSLCVRSANRDWLPTWLQWRLGADDHFKTADRTEPIIIDARPGSACLDDVMTSLFAVLLDDPGKSVEFQEALSPNNGAASRVSETFPVEGCPAERWTDQDLQDVETRTDSNRIESFVPQRGPRAWKGISLLAAVTVLSVAGSVVVQRKLPTPIVQLPVGQLVVTAAPRANEPSPIAQSRGEGKNPDPVKIPNAILPEDGHAEVSDVDRSSPVDPMPRNEEPAEIAEGSDKLQGGPTKEAAPEMSESLMAAYAEIDREVALRLEKEALVGRAEALMSRGYLQEAAECYEQAIDAANRFASLPNSGPVAHLEVARLCRTLGSLQMKFSSAAKARQTYERGRKALRKLRMSKAEVKERFALQEELDAGLRRVTNIANKGK